MSTRCQVKVIQKGMRWEEAVTLYHHCDGYPSNMLPLIHSAYEPDWEHGRAGKVASFLCAKNPGEFEPEDHHRIHQDIDWYYVLTVTSDETVGSIPKWSIEVFAVQGWGENQKLVSNGVFDSADAARRADEIEGLVADQD